MGGNEYYMSEDINTIKIEERCQSFIERCFLAYNSRTLGAKNETHMLSMLEEVVDKVEKGFTELSIEVVNDSIVTLPLATNQEIKQFLPIHTVYDAIPLNKNNLPILCTSVEYSQQWILENKAEGALKILQKSLDEIKQAFTPFSYATEWLLEESAQNNNDIENILLEDKKKIY